MAQVGEYLTIFGGTDGKELLNDLWVLEMNTGSFVDGSRVSANEWKIVDIIGPVPSPRSFHSAVKIGMDPPNPLIIYGGITDDDSSRLYALGMDNHGELRWAILPITAKGPIERRAFHSMTYGNGEIVITGGEDYTSEYPTVHQCLVYHMEARELQFTEESLPFTGHRSILINRRMSHFGGLKNIASTVYLEHIAEPNTGDETQDIANTIERNYIEEIMNRLREAEEERINNTTEEPCKNSVCAMQHQIKIPDVEHPPIPVTSTRPQRQAAKICAQKIEEAAARSLANEMQRMNDNNLEPTQPTEHSTTTQ
uniref:Uncharacterized protein n=2 Tax=Babesia bovis TaxID=5865 RepID=A7ASV1_BABBO|eukprot:XP_001609580.1 hypothetical protein [Babesia bovis T2Bo]